MKLWMRRARDILEGLETMSGAETRKRPSSVGRRLILPGPYTIRGIASSECDCSVGVVLDEPDDDPTNDFRLCRPDPVDDELLRQVAAVAAVILPLPASSPPSEERRLEAGAEGEVGEVVVEKVDAVFSSAEDGLAAVFITLRRKGSVSSLVPQTDTLFGLAHGVSMVCSVVN